MVSFVSRGHLFNVQPKYVVRCIHPALRNSIHFSQVVTLSPICSVCPGPASYSVPKIILTCTYYSTKRAFCQDLRVLFALKLDKKTAWSKTDLAGKREGRRLRTESLGKGPGEPSEDEAEPGEGDGVAYGER